MKKSTKGFYTVETAIVLPLLILALLSVGYFIKVEGAWENVLHGAVDETQQSAMKGYDQVSSKGITIKVRRRVLEDNPDLDSVEVRWDPIGSSGKRVGAYRIKSEIRLKLPLGFGHDFHLDTGIKYRNFAGKKHADGGLGRTAMETASGQYPVVIFPQSGERYHNKNCTYVKATVVRKVLTGGLKREYSACGLCHSDKVDTGSIVYCFRHEDTSYHRGTCKSIRRYTVTVDCQEAVSKGYTPCTKCGGK